MGKKKYSAIIFDVGDTLVRWCPNWADIYTGRLRKIGLNVDDSLSECISNSIYNADYQLIQEEQESGFCLDASEVDSLLDKAALKCLPILPKPIDELVQEMKNIPKVKQEMHVIPGVHGMLKKLKNFGYRLAIVSNHHSWLSSFLKENNLFEFFETVVISEDVGVKKPNTKIMIRKRLR
jgi:FMN phosphatase YigB (HAD superfamily)